MTTVTLRSKSPKDVATALRSLGITADDVGSRKDTVKALEDIKGTKELRHVISDFSKDDLKAVREALGDSGKNQPTSGNARSGVGGAGALRFRLDEKVNDPLPDVTALLAKYEPKHQGVVGRPLERVLTVTANMDNLLGSEKDVHKLADVLMQRDIRRQVFLLEGQMRMYEPLLGKAAKKGLESVKELEDALGGLSLQTQLKGLAETKGAPAEVIAHLKGTEAEARKNLETLLEEKWMPNADKRDQVPALNDIIDDLTDAKFPSYDKDRKHLSAQIADKLEGLETDEYDLKLLEEGVHEFRRDLRWVTVYVEATGGLIQHSEDKNSLPALKKLLQDPVATSKYVNLPSADREASPVTISKSLYVGVMKGVLDLGAIKDDGERMHYLSEAYVKSGAARTEADAKAKVVKLLGTDLKSQDVTADATKVYKGLVDGGILNALRHELT